MSHLHFAEVWIQLEKRTDIDNILCELIGQHTLESSILGNDSDELLNSTLRLAVYVKAIFDLQRTYSLPSGSSWHSPHLLRPKQLFLAIVYLIRLKSRVFRQSSAPTTRYVEQRSFMAQALVSGLRALWLRKYQLCADERIQLRHAFQEAWGGYEVAGFDSFLIRTLCPKMLEELSCPPSDLSSPACGEVALRDYDTGLYPLESRPNELVAAVREASSNLQPERPNWFRSYWILFDIAWTTEAALIQLCVNSAKKQKGAKVASPTPDDINHLRITQAKVWNTIIGSPATTKGDWQSTVRHSIAVTVLAQCFKEDCECSSADGYEPKRPDTTMSPLLDESLVSLAAVLESRKEELRDCNGELRDLSESLDDYMDGWYSDTSSIRLADGGSRRARRQAYIVPCEKLHPIPYDILNGLIEHSAGKVGLKGLKDKCPLIDVNISCSQCQYPSRVQCARRIEPLCHISAAIEEKIQRKLSTPRVWYQGPAYTTSRRNSSSNSTQHSGNSTGSGRTSFNGKNMTIRQGQLKEFFGEVPRRLALYSFSADGHTLLLWTRYGDHVIPYDIRSRQHEKFPASYVGFVAGGADGYAVVSIKGIERNLYVYRKNDGRLATPEFSINVPVFCIAMSSNDEFVAIGSATEVLIYRIDNRQVFRYTLSPMPNPKLDSQRVCFSAGSKKFLVATRNQGGNVRIYVSECMGDTLNPDLASLNMPTGFDNDFGLSSTLYDDASGRAYITAFTGRARPAILSPKNRTSQVLDETHHHHLGTQIQCAALSPSGLKFILVNERNEIFSVQRDLPTDCQIEKTDPLRSMRKDVIAREDMMGIAMPDEETIHLFWIKGYEWTLITILAS